MTDAFQSKTALIVGAGPGLGLSLGKAFTRAGMQVAFASRSPDRLRAPASELGAEIFQCDVADRRSIEALFDQVDQAIGTPDVVVFNPSPRVKGPLVALDPDVVHHSLSVSAFGAFIVAQQAARRMLAIGRGAILFTGASASVKGYPGSAPFAMGKFALRGLAQSVARELAPKGIHVAHFVIDGSIGASGGDAVKPAEDQMLDPDAIAATYLHVLLQPRSAWTWEVELRPWTETF